MNLPESCLAIIPARGGSKGILRKNMVNLNGKPLLSYTTSAALESKFVSRVLISTDDDEIASLGIRLGADVPFLRPAHLAADDSSSLSVIQYTLSQLQITEAYLPRIVILLQPTSPLRNANHVDQSIEKFMTTQSDVLVSVQHVPHNMVPSSLMKISSSNRLENIPNISEPIYSRHSKPLYFARNGPAIYIATSKFLHETKTLYPPILTPFLMNNESSVDIDDLSDMRIAEALLRFSNEANLSCY